MIASVNNGRWEVNQQLFRRILEGTIPMPYEKIADQSPFHNVEEGHDRASSVSMVQNQNDRSQLEAWSDHRVDSTITSCWDVRPNLYQHTLTEASSGRIRLQYPPDEHLSRVRAMKAYWAQGFEALGSYFDSPF